MPKGFPLGLFAFNGKAPNTRQIGGIMTEKITSRSNQKVRRFTALREQNARRREEKAYVLEGKRLCLDAMLSGVCISEFFYTEKALARDGAAVESLAAYAQASYCVEEQVGLLMGETRTPQGFFAVCAMKENESGLAASAQQGTLLLLESVSDPQNLGAILRTAEALGAAGVVLSGDCCDVYSPKVLRGSMGALFRLPVEQAADPIQALKTLHSRGFVSYAAVVREGESLLSCPKSDRQVAVIGNEGSGLTRATADCCTRRVTIPMKGRGESLNAAMAAGIFLWELMK